MLEVMTSRRCEHAVHLAGMDSVHIRRTCAGSSWSFWRGEYGGRDQARGSGGAGMHQGHERHPGGAEADALRRGGAPRCEAGQRHALQGSYSWRNVGRAFVCLQAHRLWHCTGGGRDAGQEADDDLDQRSRDGHGTPPTCRRRCSTSPILPRTRRTCGRWRVHVRDGNGVLPFHSESDMLWNLVVAGNMDQRAPNVLDSLEKTSAPSSTST